MDKWICSCGNENSGRFCGKCGKPMPQATAMPNQVMQSAPIQQPMQKPPYAQPQYPPQAPSGNNNAILIAVIVGLVIVVAGIFFFFVFNSSSDQKAATPAPTGSAPSQVVGNSSATTPITPIQMSDISSVTASSEDNEDGYVHAGNLTIDGNTATCWAEGIPNNVGLNSYLMYNFNGTKKVSGMQIWTGHQKRTDLFYKNARPSEIQLHGSDGSIENVHLNDSMGMQSVTFSKPMEVSNIKLIVTNVYYGNKYSDTCIAEVKFF